MDRSIEAVQAQAAETSFFSKVYMWMAGGLLTSAFSSYLVLSTPAILKLVLTNQILFFGLIIGQFALVIWLGRALFSLSVGMATGIFVFYSFLTGVTLSFIFLIYTQASLISTFAITAGTFIFFSVYGMTTKADLTRMGSLLFMGLIGIIIASVVNIFLASPVMYWIITYIGVAVFIGLIAYQTQRLKLIYQKGFESPEMEQKIAIWGALSLYISFINLFLFLLRIFGQRR